VSEWRWIEVFAAQLRACAVTPGSTVTVLSESASRRTLVDTARLAAQSLGAAVCDVTVPTPANRGPVALRSTGASVALAGNRAAVAALAASDIVIDVTVEGLVHAAELGVILAGGARVLMISNEHPENFERWRPDESLRRRVAAGVAALRDAHRMHVTSRHGTDLRVLLDGAVRDGSWGACSEPGTFAHWPGGLCVAFPAAGAVDGTLVLAAGDVNLTFKQYLRDPVTLRIEHDQVVAIDGPGVDAELLHSYLDAFADADAFTVSHVGWGMNTAARWEALALYDKTQTNGTELRAFAGNFLFSTGANENAGRFTRGHFDLPMRRCTIRLDGQEVVRDGQLLPPLA
jgi:2,5-dihydroxypyridine 5,6-dioxygenase